MNVLRPYFPWRSLYFAVCSKSSSIHPFPFVVPLIEIINVKSVYFVFSRDESDVEDDSEADSVGIDGERQKSKTPWTDNEIQNLKVYKKMNLTNKQIAKKLGRSTGGTAFKWSTIQKYVPNVCSNLPLIEIWFCALIFVILRSNRAENKDADVSSVRAPKRRGERVEEPRAKRQRLHDIIDICSGDEVVEDEYANHNVMRSNMNRNGLQEYVSVSFISFCYAAN